MGEARRRLRAEREYRQHQFELELGYLGRPPMDGEAELYAEVLAYPLLQVPRAPLDQLAWARMQPGQCHQNVYSYVRMDPEGLSTMMTGWWCHNPIFRLHSVVKRLARLVCITPSPLEVVQFRPDPLIQVVGQGFQRRGVAPPNVLRPDPLATIEAVKEARGLMTTGMDPAELPFELLERLGCAGQAG